jgi:tRNA uridine 5-carboxymethylaminomethyl modification enzyme
MFQEEYDVIVVGAGHAGSEAAAAYANLGSKPCDYDESAKYRANVLQSRYGWNCQGQIVREIDALKLITTLELFQIGLRSNSRC